MAFYKTVVAALLYVFVVIACENVDALTCFTNGDYGQWHLNSRGFSVHRYRRRDVPGSFDPLRLAGALARSGLFDDYLVYERGGEWWFAGDVLGMVSLDRHNVTARSADGRESVSGWRDRPLDAVRDALESLDVEHWNAFGWTAFEFAYLGTDLADTLGARHVMELVVPRVEVRLGAEQVSIRADTDARLSAIVDLVTGPVETLPTGHSAAVDVRSVGRAGYQERVGRAVDDIQRGRLQKVILSRTVPIDFPVDVVATYLRGRSSNNPARSFLLCQGGRRAMGFSPETVLEADSDGAVSTQPLAGTRALDGTPEADTARREELLGDPKEIYEHAISVKIAVEELTPLCRPGSVVVSDFMTVKRRGSVQHLGSRVDGRLMPTLTAWDAFQTLFPGVTASGIPKLAAYERIVDLEEQPRELYAGSVLMVSHDGSMDACLVLRSLFEQDDRAWLRAGAGIVAQSTPMREFEETCEKLGSVAPYVVARSPQPES
ncbi:salicylate synthase [Saccharothrix sp. NRRL B-16348]|uniref:salicylate synthase n=1 Tax=Saccharothrix sp. NRRL B-16348 TaxID=1415542 RepID=UPI0009E752D3|nr:salicylate synthase [Saccharothrix sp. NRRL B-16348]